VIQRFIENVVEPGDAGHDPDREAWRARAKAHGVALAGLGLIVALALVLVMKLAGYSGITYTRLIIAFAATAVVQTSLWAIPRLRLDRYLPGDPHYLFTPMLGAVALLGLYMFFAPELRLLMLVGWFVALLFLAGLGGFVEVLVLSAMMAAVYLLVSVVLYRQGVPVRLGFDANVSGLLFVLSMYAGVVFERLRRDRLEARELRIRLAALALTDALTELPNRRHFEQRLEVELDRVRRYGGRLTIALLDVDWFKHYNDTLGHPAGDIVLRELAVVMRRELRMHDLVARYGGEEFAVIMVNTDRQEAVQAIERLRSVVERYPFRDRDVQPEGRVTVSAGLASFPEDADRREQLLGQVDKALYAAKRAGRNQIRVAADLDANADDGPPEVSSP
jgi:diguanylate cyclase (GGDEF)-like protein